MKAAYLEEFGGPDKLIYGDLPDPTPKKGEVLVRVRACALNHLDLWVRSGHPAYTIKLPHVLGNDIAGVVVSAGPDTDLGDTPAGTPVVVSPGVGCGKCPACRSDRENICADYGILGANGGWGGYAELAVVPVRNLLALPREGMPFEEAASYPLTFLTSYHMLKGLARLKKGETVLVVGSGSGVGAAAIQVAKALGAIVIAASSSEAKLDSARKIGADETLHTGSEKLSKGVMKRTEGRGVDVVFEHVGGKIFEGALRLLAPGGRLVTCGATAGAKVTLDLRYVYFKELRILGAKVGSISELREVNTLIREGKLKPSVDKTFPLKEASASHAYLEARKQFGKVVLVP